ncbi:hypothetical protein TrVE_jg10980 [Triparma verrucosa]|uniref:Uncharacterized protein n=1 Tax=Triparma verrucosa TaxID=1606542 RepID=A0A9W7FMY7_9STRA|nr:hypothetical protein TrVE_jg10980 [Triparma verrucosa]
MENLQKLVGMREKNMLTDAEFSAAKEKLLGLGPSPPAPPMERMYRGGGEPRLDDFYFDAEVVQVSCSTDRGIKMPRYVERQWGGRLSEAEYQQLEEDLNVAMKGTFQTQLCCMTCAGCYLCFICGACEACGLETVVESVVEKLTNEKYQKRGFTIDATPAMKVHGNTTQWRFNVRFL